MPDKTELIALRKRLLSIIRKGRRDIHNFDMQGRTMAIEETRLIISKAEKELTDIDKQLYA